MKEHFKANDQLVTIKTVCEVLCRSRASVYRDIQQGNFPRPVKLGYSSRWRISDLNSIIESGTLASKA